jgi:hypothetical protein
VEIKLYKGSTKKRLEFIFLFRNPCKALFLLVFLLFQDKLDTQQKNCYKAGFKWACKGFVDEKQGLNL